MRQAAADRKQYERRKRIQRIRVDTIIGMAFSNLVALSIIVTTAATLHAHGKTDIQTSAQAAEALKPIAGAFAFAIFALGIVGTGLLAMPVLAGVDGVRRRRGAAMAGRASAQAEGSRAFYGVHRTSAGFGIALNFTPDQSDLGAVLERRDQRRARRAGDGAADVHGPA